MTAPPDPPDDARTEIDLPGTEDDARSVRARAAVPVNLGDRYELGALLGEGGMGEVLECRDRVLERTAALKIIRRDRRAPQLEARFVREACVQAQLEHPCVVPVYDVDRDAEGSPFFTMRKVQGITLDRVLAQTRAGDAATAAAFTRHRLLTALTQVCLTVDYAHARGVLHRDLKPANVMFGDFGEVYVLDWGLAKLTLSDAAPLSLRAGASSSSSQKTLVGTALGTPAYMPPEQLSGAALDARADVFALGALLFEILTLEPLFDEATTALRVAGKAASWDARPSARTPLRQVPPELDRICVRATSDAIEQRYPSARALHDAIEAYLGGERDLELRRTLAGAHFARAEASRSSDRDLALYEVRRALALTPDDPRGLALLVDLLKTTPSASAKAREEVLSESLERLRRAQPLGAVLLTMPWLTLYPALWAYRGVNDVRAAIAVPLAWIVNAVALLVDQWRGTQARVRYPTYAMMLALAATSLLLGPLFVVPALALTLVASHLMVSVHRLRTLTIALGCAAVVIPTALAWAGVHDVYRFSSESTFAVYGIFRTVNPVNFGALLTVMDLLMLFSTSLFAGQFRDEIERARKQNALFVWQVARLLPTPVSLSATAEPRARSAEAPSATTTFQGLRETEIDTTPPKRTSGSGPSSIISAPGEDDEPVSSSLLIGRRYEPLAALASADQETETISCRDRLIGRDVAMRRLVARSGAREDLEVDRFSRQAFLQARLDHPRIPPVYDLGQDERGPWFTTRLLKGTSLAEVFASEPAGTKGRHRRLAAFAQVCLAVDYAHARRIVHASLDPSRIIVGEFGEVSVVGWGEAAATAGGSYAAPEQVAGTGVDARTDVFALGAILYELTCGKPLFEGDERLQRVLGKYDARPSARASEGDFVAPELDAICAKACAYDPADRHASARELHDALETFMSRDRDEVLRIALGNEHLARATKGADRVVASGDESGRTDALRELGRALALLPDRTPALAVLQRLLRSPPAPLPPEVADEIAAEASSISRQPIPVAAKIAVLAGVLGFPLLALLAGVRDARATILIVLAWSVAGALALLERRLVRGARFPWAAVAGLVASATTSLLFGPYILGPTAAIALTMGFVLGGRLEWRRLFIVLGALAIAIPTALTWAGVLDVFEPRTDGRGGLSIVLRGAIYHPRDVLLGTLMVTNGLAVLVAAARAASFRDALAKIEAENRAKVLALSRLLS